MNRLTGIIVAVVGLLIIVLSVLKVIPTITSTGVWLLLLGLLLIGLSFVPEPNDEGAPRMPTAQSLLKIFYAPGEVFQNLRVHPRWFVAVLIASLFSVVYSNAFFYRLTPERVVNYTIDKTKQMTMLNDEARAKIEESRPSAIEDSKNSVKRAAQAVNTFAGQVFLIAFLSLIFFLFALAMGGKLNFWQAFSSTAYALFPFVVIRQILNLIILFTKDVDDIHPILGQGSLVQDSLNFLAVPSENPVLYSLLGAFSLLSFYWIFMNIVGLKNTGERVTSTIAWSAVLTVWFLGVVFSVLVALIFPSFLS